jgi:hypothetical protein
MGTLGEDTGALPLPSVNFIRQCRVVVQNLNEMLAAYTLGKAKKWRQVFNDGTSRRQIAFQNLVIGIENGDKFESIIASSCIFLEDETAEKQIEGIYNKVSLQLLLPLTLKHHSPFAMPHVLPFYITDK